MRIRIQVVIEGEDGHEETIEEVGCLEARYPRRGPLLALVTRR